MTRNAGKDAGAMLPTVMVAVMVLSCGCRAPASRETAIDSKVVRYSEAGSEHFAEGQTTEAMKEFRKALHRAWATDDPYHAGTNAYNVAAVLFDRGDHAAALDWLVDARVELARAGASAGNTYLLEAKIAQSEGRLEDVHQLISMAHQSPPPCGHGSDDDPCPCKACETTGHARLPFLGTEKEEMEAVEQCRDDYAAQVHLASARLATEQGDLSLAKGHLESARELAATVCSHDLRAEIHHASAMIDLANGHLLEAAAHLDREARQLRLAGNYRKIPDVLSRAAATYAQSARFDLAADRLCRVSRIWFARGELDKSWQVLQQAGARDESEIPAATRVRLKLTALEIEAAAKQADDDQFSLPENPTTDLPPLEPALLPSSDGSSGA